ncbi:hypothetical protein GCM10010492_43630 [Saccharothrix mutabilis subsp. mutabilis]|uniref:DUF2178 domain-containing protein n=1 Tax=Saccharothrix mutabilis subsp. mutabilis TaxID=66855 RepID=A0ABN0U5V2_9PSEU
MSYEERGTWVYLLVTAGTWAAYAVVLLNRDGPLVDVTYKGALLWAIGLAIVGTVVARILVEVFTRGDQKTDERDRDVNRRGEYVAGTVLGVAMVGPLALTLAEARHFWNANAMYAAFVLAAVVGSVVKLVAYRRGF